MTLLLGADPEVFVSIPGARQRMVSAHDLVPGTKRDPYVVNKGAVQADGTAAEFNIDPAGSLEEFVNNIQTVKGQLLDMLKAHDKRAELDISPVRTYSPLYWERKVPDTAKELGCDPDFNAYTRMRNPAPNATSAGSLRSAGGHIHFGFTNVDDPFDPVHILDCALLTRGLDMLLFPFSTSWDKDTTRRSLYGKPGAFRPKKYGMEYRPLSNVWISSERLISFVYRVSTGVFNLVRYNKEFRDTLLGLKQPTVCYDVELLKKLPIKGSQLPKEFNPEGKILYDYSCFG